MRHQHEHDERLQDPAKQVAMHASLLPRGEEDQAATLTTPRPAGRGAPALSHRAIAGTRDSDPLHATYAFHPHSAMFQLLVSVLLFGL